MSQTKENRRSYNPKSRSSVTTRTAVISRTAPGSYPMTNRGSMSMRMSMSSAHPTYQSGKAPEMSHKGVSNVMESRAKEKNQLNNLNERFASYIEKVRFFEVQNKTLCEELERLRKARSFDPTKIKEVYQDEITECRNIIKEMSDDKAESDAKIVDLEDVVDSLKRDLNNAEQSLDLDKTKIEALNKDCANLEGECDLLRRRVETQEDEIDRLKKDKANLQADISRARADLENETSTRLKKEYDLQGRIEELEMDNNALNEMVKEYQRLELRDNTREMKDVWKDQLRNVTKELQQTYDMQLAEMSEGMRRNYEMQLESQLAGLQRDNNEALIAKEETKVVKGKMAGLQPRISELESENASLLARLRSLQEDYDDECRCHEDDNLKQQTQISQLNGDIERIMQELSALEDAKLHLDMEISCYRKLLENEENSMRSIVEQQSNARSGGAQHLHDMISGGGGGGSSSEQKSSMSSSSMSMNVKIQRSSSSDLKFGDFKQDGDRVTIRYDGSKTQSLGGMKLKMSEGNREKWIFVFPEDVTLSRDKRTITVVSKTGGDVGSNEIRAANVSSWGRFGLFALYDDTVEKCRMNITMSEGSGW